MRRWLLAEDTIPWALVQRSMGAYAARTVCSVLLALSVGACSARSAGESEDRAWKSYQAPDGSYEARYPPNLGFREFDGDDLAEAGSFANGDVTGVIFAAEGSELLERGGLPFVSTPEGASELRLGVAAFPRVGGPWQTAEEAADLFRFANESLVGHREISFGPTTMDGVEGRQLIESNLGRLPDGSEVRQVIRMVFLDVGNSTYIISAGAFEETYQAREADVDRFFSSVDFLADAVEEGSLGRNELADAITARLNSIIEERSLPYEVVQAEFQEADEGAASNVGLPPGTWWIVQLADPFESANVSSDSARELLLYGPLKLYRDSLAPFVDELHFVNYFILAFRDAAQSTFEIPPPILRSYIAGQLTTKEMAHRIRISQLKL